MRSRFWGVVAEAAFGMAQTMRNVYEASARRQRAFDLGRWPNVPGPLEAVGPVRRDQLFVDPRALFEGRL